MPRRRAARARGPSRASLRRGAARTGCAVLGRRRAGAAAQRSRPTMTRAGRSGPARQTPASGAALNGLASGGAAAERARDCRCRRPRLFVFSRRPRARPRRAIAATNVATSRRGGCPGARIARARRTAIAMIMTRIGRGQTSVRMHGRSAMKLAASAPRHLRPRVGPGCVPRPPLSKVEALNAEPGQMTPLAHLAWAKALPASGKPGQLPRALREAADERDRLSEREVALRREAAWCFWERRKRMMDAGWQALPPPPRCRRRVCERARGPLARGRSMSGGSRHTSGQCWVQTRTCGCSRRVRARPAANALGACRP